MSLIEKLFKSKKYHGTVKRNGLYYQDTTYESDMVDLVQELESTAKRKGLKVSRWQNNNNRSGYVESITWAVHKGNRPTMSKDLPSDAHVVSLNNIEGKTKRSESYKQVKRLLDAIK